MRGSKGERESERALIEVVISRKVNIFMVKHVIYNLSLIVILHQRISGSICTQKYLFVSWAWSFNWNTKERGGLEVVRDHERFTVACIF
ncbi:unnamed protein product [Malus baccata var. baccata]